LFNERSECFPESGIERKEILDGIFFHPKSTSFIKLFEPLSEGIEPSKERKDCLHSTGTKAQRLLGPFAVESLRFTP
jgi:hypothetical protein